MKRSEVLEISAQLMAAWLNSAESRLSYLDNNLIRTMVDISEALVKEVDNRNLERFVDGGSND